MAGLISLGGKLSAQKQVGRMLHARWPRHFSTGHLAESLSWYAKRAVELARHVLERNQTRQFHDAIVVEIGPQALHLLIFHLQVGSRHSLCVVEDRLLTTIKQVALAPSLESSHFFQAYAPLHE